MKTTNDLKLLIEENKSRINVLNSEILELYKVKPYTDRVVKQVKDKYKKIEKVKQYTSNDQTAKLMELGFERPKSIISISWDVPEDDGIMINANSIEFDYRYSIGELIEILLSEPHCWVSIYNVGLSQYKVLFKKLINRRFKVLFREIGDRPIDLLFNGIVKLKGEGVI